MTVDAKDKDYIVVVQCDIVKQRCSGYYCEKAFNDRNGGFSDYSKDKAYRSLYMTCSGCCGRAVQRKLGNLVAQIKKMEEIEKKQIVVHLSSCMTKDNYHGIPCPHLDYIKAMISKVGLDVREDTKISELSEKRRKEGLYSS